MSTENNENVFKINDWTPKMGEHYWVLYLPLMSPFFNPVEHIWGNSEHDHACFEVEKCYKSKEDAQAVCDRLNRDYVESCKNRK